MLVGAEVVGGAVVVGAAVVVVGRTVVRVDGATESSSRAVQALVNPNPNPKANSQSDRPRRTGAACPTSRILLTRRVVTTPVVRHRESLRESNETYTSSNGGHLLCSMGEIENDNSASGRPQRAAIIILALLTFVLVATLYTQFVSRGADRRQEELRSSLERVFSGTTAADIELIYEQDVITAGSESAELDSFLSRGVAEPDYVRPIPGGLYEARYSTEYGGQHRCVLVTWRPDGFDLVDASGGSCRASPR